MSNQENHKINYIPHSRPTLGPEEARAVAEVIDSGHIAAGKKVANFEHAFADYFQRRYAVSTSSGTAALHLILLAMDIGPGDEVIIPSYVCTALLNAVNYVGAKPVLAEIDPNTSNLNPADVKKRLTGKTKAIIVPHMFGLAAEMDHLTALGIPIIEDCAQAMGGTFGERPVSVFGDAAIFSFYATKVMTTGEGGMVITDSKAIAERVKDLKTYDKKEDYQIRYNYEMTDLQAAIGIRQLNSLRYFINRRREIAARYNEAFAPLDVQLPPSERGHIYYRYVMGLQIDAQCWIEELKQRGIGCDRPVYLPLHRQLNLNGFALTEEVWKKSLSIPIYPTLSESQVNRIVRFVTDVHLSITGS